MTLAAINDKLRRRITEYRWQMRLVPKLQPALNYVEIALNISELAVMLQRPITLEEEEWFHEGWPVVHTLEDTEWEDLIDLYRTMTYKIQERNWLRS